MADAITVPVVGGVYYCPEHPEMGPVAVGYTGGAAPEAVSVTHDEDGLHHATAVEDEAPPAEESAEVPTGDGGGNAGDAAETPPADGSQQSTSDDGGDGANQSA